MTIASNIDHGIGRPFLAASRFRAIVVHPLALALRRTSVFTDKTSGKDMTRPPLDALLSFVRADASGWPWASLRP